jgi:hypothetical protein
VFLGTEYWREKMSYLNINYADSHAHNKLEISALWADYFNFRKEYFIYITPNEKCMDRTK